MINQEQVEHGTQGMENRSMDWCNGSRISPETMGFTMVFTVDSPVETIDFGALRRAHLCSELEDAESSAAVVPGCLSSRLVEGRDSTIDIQQYG